MDNQPSRGLGASRWSQAAERMAKGWADFSAVLAEIRRRNRRAARVAPKPVAWANWNPGLDNDHLSLGEVYRTLPTYEFSSYPTIVLALENPKSPIALKGKCNLLTHDLIHVLLGRGLFVQDEAFVIGYTMGTSKKIRGMEKEFFKFAAHRLYPPKYRFSSVDLAVFDLGFFAGQTNQVELFDVPLGSMMNVEIGKLREQFSIDTGLLRRLYAVERESFSTRASARLARLQAEGVLS